MLDQVKLFISEVEKFSATSKEEIEAFRIKYLWKKCLLNDLYKEFKNVAVEDRK